MTERELTIAYSPDDGVLLLGTSRGDGTNVVLKQFHGRWRWSPLMHQRLTDVGWYVRGSRNKKPDTLLISLTKVALENDGFTVNVIGVEEPLPQILNERSQPKATPLTVAQRAKPATNGHHTERMQVHIKDDEIVLDLSRGDSQTAVEFIHALWQDRKNTQSDVQDVQDVQSGGAMLEQIRSAPSELGPYEAIVWNYLQTHASSEAGAHSDYP